MVSPVQAAVKKEALESGIEEAMRDKEAAMAENAAHQAKCLQHEAEVRECVELMGLSCFLGCASAPAWTTTQLQFAEVLFELCAALVGRLHH